jgi:KDO2-lipid IV(A) lauroyltransferase
VAAPELEYSGRYSSPTLRHRLEYVALRAFAGVVAVLPLSVAYFVADRVGDAVYLVDGRHRSVARANLRERFRDADGRPLPESEVRRIARGSFRHLVKCAVEILRLPREAKRRGLAQIADVGGREHLSAALAAGKGVILATAHMGNWEVMGAMCQDLGVPFTTVYRPLDNPLLDAWVRKTRGDVGQTMIPKHGATRPLLKALRAGGMIVLLVDQDMRGHGVFAPFFGAPASTIPTPAELALRTGATILTGASVRVGPGFRYEAGFEPPVEVRDTGDHAADLLRVTTEINARIEALVRRAPEQWLWSHRRWKTQPPAA